MKSLKTKLKLDNEIIETESGVPESARDIGIIDDNSNINLDGTASGSYGIALGTGAQTQNTSSIAIGSGGNTIAAADQSIQLGYGINSKEKSFQVYDYELLDGNTGKIPAERLQGVASLIEENNFTGRNVFNSETQFNGPVESSNDISITNHVLKILNSTSSGDALTWRFNDVVDVNRDNDFLVNFTSNGINFTEMGFKWALQQPPAPKDTMYYSSPTKFQEVYYGNWGENPDPYRTVTFETAPSGDLLTWLQANAVSQTGQGNDTVTQYGVSEIVMEDSGTQYNLTLPKKSGTIALTTDVPEVAIDNSTITKTADGKLQAVGLQDETDSKTLTAHDIWLACSIEREV